MEDDDRCASGNEADDDDADEESNTSFGLDSIVKVAQHAVAMRKTPGKSTVPKGIQPIFLLLQLFFISSSQHTCY